MSNRCRACLTFDEELTPQTPSRESNPLAPSRNFLEPPARLTIRLADLVVTDWVPQLLTPSYSLELTDSVTHLVLSLSLAHTATRSHLSPSCRRFLQPPSVPHRDPGPTSTSSLSSHLCATLAERDPRVGSERERKRETYSAPDPRATSISLHERVVIKRVPGLAFTGSGHNPCDR